MRRGALDGGERVGFQLGIRFVASDCGGVGFAAGVDDGPGSFDASENGGWGAGFEGNVEFLEPLSDAFADGFEVGFLAGPAAVERARFLVGRKTLPPAKFSG